MAQTTAKAFFAGLQEDLREGLSGLVPESSVYLIAVPVIDTTDAIAVQIVPGRLVNTGPRAGNPLIVVEFDITIWLRSFHDYAQQDSSRLVDDTWSAYETIDRIQKLLIGGLADDQATVMIQYLSTERPVTNPEQNGWVTITDHYRAAIEGKYR